MPLRQRTVRARNLRRKATDVERRLWRALREGCAPWKFRRQHPIGRRIADFACPARKLVVELDGGQHAERASDDAARTEELAQFGYRVIRFWNGDIANNLDGVLEAIRVELLRPTSPRPSPPLRGGEGVEPRLITRSSQESLSPPLETERKPTNRVRTEVECRK